MERKNWGPFTGTHLTILLTAAALTLVPTALWSVAAFSNVAILDPITGKQVAVDAARRMFVYDQIGDQDETPGNFVNIFFFAPSSCTGVYTVPPGKAFILKGMNAYMFKANTGSADLQTIIFSGNPCSSDNVVAGAVSSQVQD